MKRLGEFVSGDGWWDNMDEGKSKKFPLMNIPLYLFTTFLSIFLISTFPSLIEPANSDGLFMEELSANFDDREADLIIKMTPPVVTNDTLQNQNQKPIIQFKLYGGGAP
ncbi:MAG: hypothetical protein WAL24_05310 [Nitrososphaeraceae archaeon]